jgi:DNA-binding NarL/FixJ family response regulator
MKIEHGSDKIYLSMERDEILIHVPFRVIFEEVRPKLQGPKTFVPKLTRRELVVLDSILAGKANKEIANELRLSERTVKFHVSSLLSKHQVGSRLQLPVIYANAERERT